MQATENAPVENVGLNDKDFKSAIRKMFKESHTHTHTHTQRINGVFSNKVSPKRNVSKDRIH